LLDIKGKTKEGLNSRLDLVNLGIRKELHPIPQPNGKYLLSAASYNLNPGEKHEICVWLKTSTFLPIAIRALKPVFVKMAITRLCYLFNKILLKVIDRDKLESL
jgi:hypothetical protein